MGGLMPDFGVTAEHFLGSLDSRLKTITGEKMQNILNQEEQLAAWSAAQTDARKAEPWSPLPTVPLPRVLLKFERLCPSLFDEG